MPRLRGRFHGFCSPGLRNKIISSHSIDLWASLWVNKPFIALPYVGSSGELVFYKWVLWSCDCPLPKIYKYILSSFWSYGNTDKLPCCQRQVLAYRYIRALINKIQNNLLHILLWNMTLLYFSFIWLALIRTNIIIDKEKYYPARLKHVAFFYLHITPVRKLWSFVAKLLQTINRVLQDRRVTSLNDYNYT